MAKAKKKGKSKIKTKLNVKTKKKTRKFALAYDNGNTQGPVQKDVMKMQFTEMSGKELIMRYQKEYVSEKVVMDVVGKWNGIKPSTKKELVDISKQNTEDSEAAKKILGAVKEDLVGSVKNNLSMSTDKELSKAVAFLNLTGEKGEARQLQKDYVKKHPESKALNDWIKKEEKEEGLMTPKLAKETPEALVSAYTTVDKLADALKDPRTENVAREELIKRGNKAYEGGDWKDAAANYNPVHEHLNKKEKKTPGEISEFTMVGIKLSRAEDELEKKNLGI